MFYWQINFLTEKYAKETIYTLYTVYHKCVFQLNKGIDSLLQSTFCYYTKIAQLTPARNICNPD